MSNPSPVASADPIAAAHAAIEAVEAVIMAGLPIPATTDVVSKSLFARVDGLAQLAKELQRLHAQLKEMVEKGQDSLVEQFTMMGVDEIGFDGRFGTLQSKLAARKKDPTVTSADVVTALRADGLTELVTEPSYNHQSLSAYLRGLEDEKKPIPKNLATVVEGYETFYVGFTTRRPNRARARRAGAHSAVLDGES